MYLMALSQLLMSNCEQLIRKDAEGRKVCDSDWFYATIRLR